MRHPIKKNQPTGNKLHLGCVCVHTCASGEAAESSVLHRDPAGGKRTDEGQRRERGCVKNVAGEFSVQKSAETGEVEVKHGRRQVWKRRAASVPRCSALRVMGLTWRSFTNNVRWKVAARCFLAFGKQTCVSESFNGSTERVRKIIIIIKKVAVRKRRRRRGVEESVDNASTCSLVF